MSQQRVSAFLPCRKGSERIKNKNTKKFGDKEGGLLSIKLEQLLDVPNIDFILLSTNDQEVIDLGNSFNSSKIKIDRRPESLASSATSTDELIGYVPSVISSEHILWTHVTSPFIQGDVYADAIKTYFDNIQGENYDSLMSVTKHQKFFWNETGPVNYNREVEKWPRTQTLPPLYEINSGFFLAPRNVYLNRRDRIGTNPYKFILDEITSYDIDWEENFKVAETMYMNNLKK